MFGTILISVCTLMHLYIFWRAASVPFVDRHVPRKILIGTGVILWAVFLAGRVIGHGGTGDLAVTLEFLGMNWMGILFLTFIPLFSIDLVTLFGFLMPRLSPSLRGWALLVGGVFSAIALFQGLRPPVVEKYEVVLPGLPDTMDGIVLAALSDMHLGSQLGERWLAARIAQVNEQQPDIVVLLGDIFEGHGPPDKSLMETFRHLSAPLGIWAIPGNHEFHGRGNMALFEAVGFTLLRNGWAEVGPGLILAGVDDLTVRRRNGQGGDPMSQALAGRPPGAAILLSHTPGRPRGRRKPARVSCYPATPTEGRYGHSTIWFAAGIHYWRAVTKWVGWQLSYAEARAHGDRECDSGDPVRSSV